MRTTANAIRRWISTLTLLMAVFFAGQNSTWAQTVLMDSTTNGGFETGSTFASNGWTSLTLNPTADQWILGTAPTAFGSRCAYISSTPAGTQTFTYSLNSTFNHLYTDVTIPAGQPLVTIRFRWKAGGEGGSTSDWDNMKVFWGTTTDLTSIDPVAAVGSTYQVSGNGATSGMYKLSSASWNAGIISVSGVPGTTYRLVFSWKADGTDIANPPSAIDNVHITSAAPATFTATANGGLWSSAATWVGGVVPGSGNDIDIPAGSKVTIDQSISYRNFSLSGILNWNGTAPSSTTNAMTVTGNFTINAGGVFNAYSTAGGGPFVNIQGNFINNGYANLALVGGLTFNGSGSTLSGTGTFEGDGTNGIIRVLSFSNTGSNTINTSQNLIVNAAMAHTAGSLNTNGKLRIDNTATFLGRAVNQQVVNVAVTNMGTGYTADPGISGVAMTAWSNITGTLNTLYYSGGNIYRCTSAANIGPSAPTHTSGISQNLLWVGTVGSLAEPFRGAQTHTVGTQYFYGDNLYVCTASTAAASTAAPPIHTSGTAVSGGVTFLYLGSVAKVSVNRDATTSTIRSLNIVNAGSGYMTTPTIVFSAATGAGSGAAATCNVITAVPGTALAVVQRSGVSTVSGGITINSDQNVGTLSADPQASSGVGAVYVTGGGVNYTIAPQVGFSGPTALNLVTNAGSGYTTAPTITITGGTQPAGATALVTGDFTITVNQGRVVSVYLNTTVTKTYITPPTLAFSGGGGSGATLAFPANCWPAATANIGSNRQVVSFTMTNSGYGYVATPSVALGNASATVTGGTYTTAATGLTARIAAYYQVANFFSPAASAEITPDDAYIPTSRKMHALWLNGAGGNGMNLSGNLTLFSGGTSTTLSTTNFPSPLVLTVSAATTGNILNLNGNHLYFSWNGYAGATTTYAPGTAVANVKNGAITLTTRGGGSSGSTLNFPFNAYPSVYTGSTPTAVTTGADVLSVKVTESAAPTNTTPGGDGIALGTRSYRVETFGVGGAAGTAGTNPTVTLRYNQLDSLTTLQNQTFVAEATALSGAWNRRSDSIGGNSALAVSGSKTTGTTAPTRGPIALTSGNYYAWSTSASTITNVDPLLVCANSGTITIAGTNLTGVTAVKIGGTAVTSFTIVNADTIIAVAGNGTDGVVSVVKNGLEISGTQSVTVTGSPAAPSVSATTATTINQNGSVSFEATGTGGTITWYDVASGGTALATGSTYTAANICSNKTYYAAEDNGSCIGARAPISVTVTRPAISATTSLYCGLGGTDTLTVTPSDPNITYTWTSLTSGTTLTTSVGEQVSASISGTSEFRVVGTSGSCSDSAFYSVGVYPLPTANLTTTASGVCPGTTAIINSGLVSGNFTAACITPNVRPAPASPTYLALNGAVGTGGGTALTTGNTDDGGWGGIPLGFTFNFFGTPYTTVNVGTNGVLQFGTYNSSGSGGLGDYTIGALPNTADPRAAIFLGSHDLSVGSDATNPTFVRYWTEGYAPNRRFIIEYSVNKLSTTNRQIFQCVLYETLGIVDIVCSQLSSNLSKSIGINSPTGLVGATAPNCAVTPNTANYWSAQTATIASGSPQAWRFSPADNYTVNWYADDILYQSGTNVFADTVAPLITTRYEIRYTNQTTGCVNSPRSAEVTIEVLSANAPTGVTTLASADSICAGGTVNLSLDYAGILDGLAFSWQQSVDGGITWDSIPGATSATYTASPTAVTSYRCRIISCGGAPEFTSTKTIYYTRYITSVTSATRCGTGTGTLSATANANNIRWFDAQTGGTNLGTVNSGEAFVTPSVSTTTVFWAEPRQSGCAGLRVPDTLFVNPAPAFTIDSASLSICSGATSALVSLTAGANDYDQISWSPATGVSGSVGSGWTFNPTSTTTYTLSASQSAGICVASVTLPVTVNSRPVIDSLTASATTVCAGTEVTLNAYSGSLSTGPQAVPTGYCTPTSSGGSCITSVSFNSLNYSSVGCASGNYSEVSAATATTTVNRSQAYTFSMTSDGAIASVWIDWDRSGTFDASEWNQVYTSGTSGSITITVPSNASLGLTKMRVRTRATGNTNGSGDACSSFGSGECEDFTINVIGLIAQTPGVSFTWNPGGLSGTSISVTPSSTTDYIVTAVNTTTGCTSALNDTITVTVNPLPDAPETSNSSQCGLGIPTCFATGTTNGNYRWYLTATGGTALAGETNNSLSTYSIGATTTFYVSINNGTCESARVPVTASVTLPDAIEASVDNDTICLGAPIALSVAQNGTSNTYVYTWTANPSSGSGIATSETGASVSVTPSSAGTYNYVVTAVDAALSCTILDTVTVLVNGLPAIGSITATPDTICAGETVSLSVTSPGIGTGPQVLPTGYCAGNTSGSNADEQIFEVIVGSMTNTQSESCAINYTDYTSTITPITMTTGDVVPFSVTVNECDGPTFYSTGLAIFIDLNRDGDFEDASERLYTSNGTTIAPVTRTGTLTIPSTASAGLTRMRVVALEDVNNPTPCGSGYGESEDYAVNILATISVNPSYNYSWNPGALSGNTASVTPASTTEYVATVTDPATGCSNSDTVTVVVNPLPLAPTANSSEQCGAGIPTASVVSNSGEATPIFNWYTQAVGGTAAQSGTSSTYTSTITTTTSFYVSETTAAGCEGPRAEVVVTVNQPDDIEVLASDTTVCLGSTFDISASYSPVSNLYDTYTLAGSAAASGISGTETLTVNGFGTDPFTVTPTAVGAYTYTITATDNSFGCATQTSVNVTVVGLPVINAASGTPSTICEGQSVNLSANTAIVSSGSVTLGAGASTSSSTGTPFYGGWGGTKVQYIYTAAELAATGLVAGNITSIGLNVTSAAAISYGGFGISIGSTVNNTFASANAVSGLTQVYSGAYTPTSGVNTFAFSTPYFWNGTSNIVLSFCYSNNNTSNSASTIQTDVYTGTNVGMYIYADNQTAETVCGATTTIPASGGSATTTTRARTIFNGQVGSFGAGTLSWSWEPGAVSGNTATVTPTTSTTYVVTATDANGCIDTAQVNITVNPLPTAPVGTNSTQCGVGIPTASVASGDGTASPVFNWYNSASDPSFVSYYNNGFSTTLNGATSSGNASLAGGQLILTPNSTNQLGGLTIPAIGVNAEALNLAFNMTTGGGGGADGFSYSFGDDVSATATSPNAEVGTGTKLKLSFDTYGSGAGASGIRLIYGSTINDPGTTVGTNGILAYSSNSTWVGGSNVPVVASVNTAGQFSLTVNGTSIFNNVQLPAGYTSANKAAWQHVFKGRTGGLAMLHALDSLNIAYYNAGLVNTGSTYTSSVSQSDTFYVAEVSAAGCAGPRTEVIVTVNQPDTLVASSANICIGDTVDLTATVTSNANNNTYTLTWSAAAAQSGISGTTSGGAASFGTPAITQVVPTAAGTYTYTVTGVDGACSASSTVSVTVNGLPLISTINQTPDTICAGSTVSLTATSVPSAAGTATVGAGATSTSTYTAPFYSAWSNKHMQILYRASELQAAGLVAGNITSLSFPTTSGTTALQNFSIKLGHTSNTTAASFVTTGLTEVFAAATQAQVANTNNTIALTTPFAWNGTSNLIIEICFGNSSSTATLSSTSPADATTYVSVIKTHTSAATSGSTQCANTATNSATYSTRPKVLFGGVVGTNVTNTLNWSWTGGATGNPASVSPTTTTAYFATATNPTTGCSITSTDSVVVTVVPVSANATSSVTGASCSGSNVTLNANAVGQGPFTYSWSDGSTVVGTTSSPVVAPTSTTTYTVTVSDACNNSTTSSVTVNVNALPTVSISETNSPVNLCSPATQTLTAVPSTSAVTFQWMLNGTNISGATSASYTASATGTYTVKVTDTTISCTSLPSGGFVVNYYQQPSPITITPAASTTLCLGQTVSLTATGGSITTNNVTALAENFDANATSWTISSDATSPAGSAWTIRTAPYTLATGGVLFNNFSTPQGGKFILANSDVGGTGTTTRTFLTSPVFNTTNFTSATLAFEHTFRRLGGADSAAIEISTNGGTTWANLQNYTASQGTTTNNAQATTNASINLGAAYLNQANLRIRFRYKSAYGYFWLLDNVRITGTTVENYTYNWSPSASLSAATGATVTASPTTTTTYTVGVTSQNSCSREQTITVTVNERPTAAISGGATYCANASSTSTTLSIAVTGTGPWSGTLSNGQSFSGSSSPISVTVAPSSTTTYTVATLSDANCTAQAGDISGSAIVTIISNPVAPTLSVTQPTCSVATGTITVTAPVGVGFEYNIGSGFQSSPVFAGLAPGSYSISVQNSAGCAALTSSSATVNPQPFVPATPTVTGPQNICNLIGTEQTATYVASTPGATSYTWTIPAFTQIISGQGTNTLVVRFLNGFATQTVSTRPLYCKANSVCGSSINRIYSLYAVLPQTPRYITPSTADVCPSLGTGVPITYTTGKIVGAASYIWTAQAGTTNITSVNGAGENDTVVAVTFESNFTTSSISVRAVNDCGVSSLRSITISRSNPATPALISGPTNACAYIGANGQVATYSVAALSAFETYNWTIPAGATDVTGSTTRTISFRYPDGYTGGTISVQRINGCGSSGTRSLSIGVLQATSPTSIDVVNTATCPNRVYTYSVSSMPSQTTSLLWTIPSGGTIVSGQGTTSITVSYTSGVIAGEVTVRGVNNCSVGSLRRLNVKLQACPTGFAGGDGTLTKGNTATAVTPMEVQVFPNPSAEAFNLQVITAAKETVKVRVLDVSGRFIRSYTIAPNTTLNLGATLKSGSYLLEVTQGRQQKTVKAIKL